MERGKEREKKERNERKREINQDIFRMIINNVNVAFLPKEQPPPVTFTLAAARWRACLLRARHVVSKISSLKSYYLLNILMHFKI